MVVVVFRSCQKYDMFGFDDIQVANPNTRDKFSLNL